MACERHMTDIESHTNVIRVPHEEMPIAYESHKNEMRVIYK